MLSKGITIGEKDISSVKALVAQKLRDRGLTQSKISSLLNITQPMVHKYLSSNVRKKNEKTANLLVEMILKENKITFSYMAMVDQISEDNEVYISTGEHLMTDEKSWVLENMMQAVERIKEKDFSSIIPSVKMNLAMSVPHAQSKAEIAAVPGGLIFISGMLKSHLEPEFGTSNHLSSLLLYARALRPNLCSIMNIGVSENMIENGKKHNLNLVHLKEDYTLETEKTDFDAFIHKGGFGIEPNAYIFGTDALEVISKCLKLV